MDDKKLIEALLDSCKDCWHRCEEPCWRADELGELAGKRLKEVLDQLAAVRDISHVCRTCDRFQGGACVILAHEGYSHNCVYWQWRGPREAGEGHHGTE